MSSISMSFLSMRLSSTARTWNRDSASTTVMAAERLFLLPGWVSSLRPLGTGRSLLSGG